MKSRDAEVNQMRRFADFEILRVRGRGGIRTLDYPLPDAPG